MKGPVCYLKRQVILAALILAVVCILRGMAAAAENIDAASWTRLTDTGGVPATALARDSSGRLYAGTYYQGLFLSADEANWSNPLPNAVAAIAPGPNVAYAGTWGGGVYKSTDNGGHWSAANTGLQAGDVYALAIEPAAPNTIYAGTEAGVFRTTDGGGNWAAASSGLGPRVVYALAFLGSALYAGTDRGVYVTTNGGGSWSSACQGLAAGRVLSLAAGGGKLYSGTDQGVFALSGSAWAKAGGLAAPVHALALNPKNPAAVIAGTANGVYVSLNAGGAWRPFSGGLSGYALEVAGLALDGDVEPAVVYAATGDGLWRAALELPPLRTLYLPSILR
jgi:ligand-binding sensor domain-containing protein